MEISIDIYADNGRDIVKTYTSSEFNILFGAVEDIIAAVDMDNITDEDSLVRVAVAASGSVRPLLKGVFEGITDDEIKHIRLKDIVPVTIGILSYALKEMKDISGGATRKNP